MNKELPCYIVSDLLPFYEDELLSEETINDINEHISECEACKKKMDTVKMHIDVKPTATQLKGDPLMKVRQFQKIQAIWGAVIAFILGFCLPVAYLGSRAIINGGVKEYQIERVKRLWYVLVADCFISGAVICGSFLVVLFITKRCVSNKVN